MVRTKYKQELLILIIILVVASAIYSLFLFINPVTMWDENVYLGNARSHIGVSNFTEDFRFPLLEYVLASIWFITGESLLIARIVMILFSLASILAFYLITKEMFSERLLYLTATSLFAISPLMIYWSFRIYTDIPAVCAMLFSIVFFLKYYRKKQIAYIFGSGVLTSIAFLFRFPVVLFAIILVGYLILDKQIKASLFFSLGSGITLIPWMIYNWLNYNNPIWDLLAQGGAVATYTTMQPFSILIIRLIETMGLLLIGLIPFLWWLFFAKNKIRVFKKRSFFKLFFIITLVEILFYGFVVRLKLSRYLLTIIPFIIIIGLAGIYWLFDRISKDKKKLILIIVFIVFFLQLTFVGVLNIHTIYKEDFCKQPLYDAVEFVKETYPSDSLIMATSWPWFGYYGNFKVSSTWSNNISLLLNKTSPDVVVLNKWGLVVNKDDYLNCTSLKKINSFSNSCGDEVIILDVDTN